MEQIEFDLEDVNSSNVFHFLNMINNELLDIDDAVYEHCATLISEPFEVERHNQTWKNLHLASGRGLILDNFMNNREVLLEFMKLYKNPLIVTSKKRVIKKYREVFPNVILHRDLVMKDLFEKKYDFLLVDSNNVINLVDVISVFHSTCILLPHGITSRYLYGLVNALVWTDEQIETVQTDLNNKKQKQEYYAVVDSFSRTLPKLILNEDNEVRDIRSRKL